MKLIITILAMLTMVNLSNEQPDATDPETETAVFGAGCFWCVEAIYQRVNGIVAVESGYAGGHVENPTYEQVITGKTGHAEVARVTFKPAEISYEELLEVFWHTHNPTTLNRQGADVGTQYRSAIFYVNDEQRDIALKSLQKTNDSDLWADEIVTEVTPLTNYSTAEDYHQNYFNNNPNAGYCSVVIAPKIAKFKKDFPHLLQESL